MLPGGEQSQRSSSTFVSRPFCLDQCCWCGESVDTCSAVTSGVFPALSVINQLKVILFLEASFPWAIIGTKLWRGWFDMDGKDSNCLRAFLGMNCM